MSYIDDSLMPNEAIAYRVRLHWMTFLTPVTIFILGIIAWGVSTLQVFEGALFLIAAALMIPAMLNYVSSELAVTNRRVIVKVGFLSRDTFEILLDKVESIEVAQGLFGRIFNYGTITVKGVGGTSESFRRIEEPLQFRRKVQEQIAAIK